MSFLKLSREAAERSNVTLSNVFIREYLPPAEDTCLKVYLLGLCFLSSGETCDAESLARALSVDVSAVGEAFEYWQDQGLVRLSDSLPLSVEYLPVVSKSRQIRKFSKEKYKTFNEQLHAVFPRRNILPNEYNEYYSLMEMHNIEVEAMLTIIGYCKRTKGEDITYPYILAVARNLANEGCTTFDRVNERLSELNLYDDDLKAVLKALGSKRKPELEDRRLYGKWTKNMGFTPSTVVYVAKQIKRGGMNTLDARLTKYYKNRVVSREEIENYQNNYNRLYELAKTVNQKIGVYYEQLDNVIETYTSKWLNMGFDENALTLIADNCFKKGIRTLDGMNGTVDDFYRKGIITVDSIDRFVSEAVRDDEQIRAILEEAGVGDQTINSNVRSYYHCWTYSWNMSNELILHAATLSRGALNPIQYLNKILANWHENKVTDVAQAQGFSLPDSAPRSQDRKAPADTDNSGYTVTATGEIVNKIHKHYSAEELNALFDKLNEDL